MNGAEISPYVYLAVVVGTFLEGETVLLTAGALAHDGTLSLGGVIACAWCASTAWDQLWFQLGRRLGKPALARNTRWKPGIEVAQRWLSRNATLFVFGYRFVAGLGTVAPLLLGTSAVSQRRFVLVGGLAAASWACLFASIGWGVGASIRRVFGQTSPWLVLPAIFGVCIGLAWGVSRFRVTNEPRT
jgi:membrane protein DedA with SNARE-associated domain